MQALKENRRRYNSYFKRMSYKVNYMTFLSESMNLGVISTKAKASSCFKRLQCHKVLFIIEKAAPRVYRRCTKMLTMLTMFQHCVSVSFKSKKTYSRYTQFVGPSAASHIATIRWRGTPCANRYAKISAVLP